MNLQELPAGKIRAIFSDLDDTLTDDSKILPETYQILWELKARGFWLVVVSGRPAGWADCLMRLMPFDAVTFENGAGVMVRDGNQITTRILADSPEREQKAILQGVFDELKSTIPNLKLATDQAYRRFDFAIDYAEEAPFLTPHDVETVLRRLASKPQITHKLSSIHVNYWCGMHTKVSACQSLMKTEGKTLGISAEQVVYCGDSPNDEPMFAYFKHTVGVANIQKFLAEMQVPPRYFTEQSGGRGFTELARHLLNARP